MATIYNVIKRKSPKWTKEIEAEICNVFAKSNSEKGYPLVNPKELLKHCNSCILAYDLSEKKKLVGYAIIKYCFKNNQSIVGPNDKLYNSANNPKGMYIEQICVLPEHQGEKIGSYIYKVVKFEFDSVKNRILSHTEEFQKAKVEMNNNIYAHIDVNNRQSLIFHRKQGFIPIGDYICDNFYGKENYHSLLMELTIDERDTNGWIPCAKRLPDEPKPNVEFEGKPLELYLVSVEDEPYPFRAFWNGKNFTDGMSKLNVAAWQPLPSVYKNK